MTKNISEKRKEKYEFELMSGKFKTNHILHLILSILTAGGWLFIWPIIAWRNDVGRVQAEEVVYGASEPNWFTRILGIASTIILILSIIGFIIGMNAASQQFEEAQNSQTQTEGTLLNDNEHLTFEEMLKDTPEDKY
jgi:hypothetical protein